MTRMPDLERELVAAAQRRYAMAPRRRPSLGALRLLAPLAVVLLLAVATASSLRSADPEIEAPTRPATPEPTLEDLRRGPLGISLGDADPAVPPVSLRVDRWTAGGWAEPGGYVCHGASLRRTAAGESCGFAGLEAAGLRANGGAVAERLSDEGVQLVYGFALPDVEAIEVEIGGETRAAAMDDRLLTVTVSEAERAAVALDGGEVPPAGPVGFRLFAASFPDGGEMRAALRVRFADGRRTTVSLPVTGPPGDGGPPVGCYRTPDLEADMAVPDEKGPPLKVCRQHWHEKGFEDTPRRLTVCRGPGDAAPLVFPGGRDVCARLGLESYGG